MVNCEAPKHMKSVVFAWGLYIDVLKIITKERVAALIELYSRTLI